MSRSLFAVGVILLRAQLGAAPLFVDIGRQGAGTVQSSWQGFHGDSVDLSAPFSATNFGLGSSGEDVTVSISGHDQTRQQVGFNGDWTSGPGAVLADMLDDGALIDTRGTEANPRTMQLTLAGLADGRYNLTTFHHDADFGYENATFTTNEDAYHNTRITDGAGGVSSSRIVTTRVRTPGNADLRMLSASIFDFTVDQTIDGGDVVVEFQGFGHGAEPGGTNGGHLGLNGFVLDLDQPLATGPLLVDIGPVNDLATGWQSIRPHRKTYQNHTARSGDRKSTSPPLKSRWTPCLCLWKCGKIPPHI